MRNISLTVLTSLEIVFYNFMRIGLSNIFGYCIILETISDDITFTLIGENQFIACSLFEASILHKIRLF